jgi:DNA repair exonuclease SbcCD nuclease subunit
MIKGIAASDFHLGLVTDDLDRTDEIMSVMRYIFKYAVKEKCQFVALPGDIFHTNSPTDHQIGLFISALNILRDKPIKVFIVPGNHECRHKGRSCLSFLKELKDGYPNVNLIDDIKTVRVWESKANNGSIYFTFIPYFYKTHIDETKYKSVQEYINKKCEKIQNKIPMYAKHIVFSHLLVEGTIVGSEESMLKRANLFVPDVLTKKNQYGVFPIVINGHQHTKNRIGNIRIIGSPIFCRFDEKEEHKYFVQLRIPTVPFNNPKIIKYMRTPCHKFEEFDIDLLEGNTEETIKSIRPRKNSIVKLNVTCRDTDNFDFDKIREQVSAKCHYVKPIQPRYVRKRVKRNEKQKMELNPEDAVKMWVKKNKPKNSKAVLNKAKKYIEEVLT